MKLIKWIIIFNLNFFIFIQSAYPFDNEEIDDYNYNNEEYFQEDEYTTIESYDQSENQYQNLSQKIQELKLRERELNLRERESKIRKGESTRVIQIYRATK